MPKHEAPAVADVVPSPDTAAAAAAGEGPDATGSSAAATTVKAIASERPCRRATARRSNLEGIWFLIGSVRLPRRSVLAGEPEVEAEVSAPGIRVVDLDGDRVGAGVEGRGRDRERDRGLLGGAIADDRGRARGGRDGAGRHVVAGDLDAVHVD